jgi:putative sterol carrier protein
VKRPRRLIAEEACVDETAKKQLKVRVMMHAMLASIAEVSKEDPNVQAQLAGWDRVIQYSVRPDGPHMHLVIESGTVTHAPGLSERATATIKFADLDTAAAIFTRKLDAQAAFLQGKVQLAGDMTDAMKIAMVTQLAMAYFT